MPVRRASKFSAKRRAVLILIIFPQLGLPIRGSYWIPKQPLGCVGLSAPRVPRGLCPPRVPWASRAWFLSPKVKSQKCPKFQTNVKTLVFCCWHSLNSFWNNEFTNVNKKCCAAREVKCQTCQMPNVKKVKNMSTVKYQMSQMSNVKCQTMSTRQTQSNVNCQM